MPVQPLDAIIQLVLGEVVVLGIACGKLAAVNGTESPFHSPGNPFVELVENLLECIDVVLPEVGNRPEIRLHSLKHPFDFQIHLAALGEFPGGLDSVVAAVDIQFEKCFRVVGRPALRCHFLHSISGEIEAVHKSINKPCRALWIYPVVPRSHHKLIPVKRLHIMHLNHPEM